MLKLCYILPLSFICMQSINSENRAFELDKIEYQHMYNIGKTLTAKIEWHDFAESYSHYFKNIKEMPIKLLEIGILNGDSLVLWEKYFPNAEIHGIDTTFDYIIHKFDRAICHLADQSKAEDLLRVVNDSGGNFDIIIDDGGHLPDLQITSFITLFPYLNSGGLYIVEDLHTAYWTEYAGSGNRENPDASGHTMVTFLKNLIDEVNFVGAATGRASHKLKNGAYSMEIVEDRLNEYRRDILSIHFYDSIYFIIKR